MPSSAHLGQVVDQVLLPRSMRQQSRKLLRLEVREGGRRSTLRPTRTDRMDGYGKVGIPVIGLFSYMVLAFMKEIISVLTNDRVGLSKSVIFLFVFVILHAVGNLHVLWRPGILMGTDISIRSLLFMPRRAPFDLFETDMKRNFESCDRRVFITDDSVDPRVVEFCELRRGFGGSSGEHLTRDSTTEQDFAGH